MVGGLRGDEYGDGGVSGAGGGGGVGGIGDGCRCDEVGISTPW